MPSKSYAHRLRKGISGTAVLPGCFMKPFSLLVKPASADCNLRCAYCFYLDRAGLYPDTARHRMSPAVLERMIASYMATDQPQYAFGWQGGEPTLMGLEFFRTVTTLQQQYGRPGAMVANGLQTNAVKIDDPLAAHLAKYKFLVGVSIDGPPKLHDLYRRTPGDKGSHARVLRGIERLKRHGVEFNALVLVSTANAGRARELFRYLCGLGIFHHQYIPCVEFDSGGHPLPYTISGHEWGAFLCELFDEWTKVERGKVSIRLFDSVLSLMVDGESTVCHMGDTCCQYFVVEYNGDVYPCDFFVEDSTRLGNIMTDSWESLLQSGRYAAFGRQKAAWCESCAHCECLHYCAGGCLKDRAGGPQRPSWLCDGWKRFYEHALPGLADIAEWVREQRGKEGD